MAQLGNTNAKGKRVWSDALRKHAIQTNCVDKIAKKLLLMAEGGDMAAIKELGDRLEGKSVQSTQISGPDDEPLTITLKEYVYGQPTKP